MKTATITLAVTPSLPMPAAEPPFSAQAGFRLTLTRNSTGASVSTPIEDKLVWTIGNFVEDEGYSLLVESVDALGRVIQALPTLTFTVPPAPTYTRLDALGIAWS